jgi:mono/diheme cytochrome c family protein
MRRNKWIAVVTLATAGWLTACGGDAGETEDAADTPPETTEAPAPAPAPTQPTGAAPEGATPEMVTAGQAIFTGKGMCITCHGPTATGTPLAPNLTDGEWINISGNDWNEIQGIVRTGVPTPQQHPSPMPPMGGAQLTDQEIQQVAAYVYSLSHQGS